MRYLILLSLLFWSGNSFAFDSLQEAQEWVQRDKGGVLHTDGDFTTPFANQRMELTGELGCISKGCKYFFYGYHYDENKKKWGIHKLSFDVANSEFIKEPKSEKTYSTD